ncbi:IS66 family transposase, partial [Xenorhabdus bovienii]|uniref:IS66 family transposase n=1 Tax=Xenorhabdus bovienii TaxID=40576 RepID=UPI0023B270C7
AGTDAPDRQSNTPNIVLYDYQTSRSGTCAAGYLAGFQGYLHVDVYLEDDYLRNTLNITYSSYFLIISMVFLFWLNLKPG